MPRAYFSVSVGNYNEKSSGSHSETKVHSYNIPRIITIIMKVHSVERNEPFIEFADASKMNMKHDLRVVIL